jgi:hypothetical protein
MVNTSYSFMTMEELMNYTQTAPSRTELEVELAQRLEVALAMVFDLEGRIDDDAGRTG